MVIDFGSDLVFVYLDHCEAIVDNILWLKHETCRLDHSAFVGSFQEKYEIL